MIDDMLLIEFALEREKKKATFGASRRARHPGRRAAHRSIPDCRKENQHAVFTMETQRI